MTVRTGKIWMVSAVTVMMMMMSPTDAFGGVSSSHLTQQLSLQNEILNNKIITSTFTRNEKKKKNTLFLTSSSRSMNEGSRRWWRRGGNNKRIVKLTQSFQKMWKLVGMMAIVWNFSMFHNPSPAHASLKSSSSTTTTMVSRGGSTAAATSKLEQRLVDRYVRNYMFNDDVYDPVESTYRETITDAGEDSYSKQLSDTVSQVLGKSTAASITVANASKGDAKVNALLKVTTNLVNFLTVRLNLPSGLAYLIVSGVVFGFPAFLLAIGGLMFSAAQRTMTDRMAADRYGADNVDLDATERIEDEDSDDDDDDYGKDENDDDDSYDSEDESDDE